MTVVKKKTNHDLFDNSEIRKIKIPDKETLIALWKRHQEGDTEAYKQLYESQLRLAYQIADSFGSCKFRDDLRSEAALAVAYAIQFWDPQRGCLSTLVSAVCYQRILKYLSENAYPVRYPFTALKKLRQQGEHHKLDDTHYLNDKDQLQYDERSDKDIEELLNHISSTLQKQDKLSYLLFSYGLGIFGKRLSIAQLSRTLAMDAKRLSEKFHELVDSLQGVLSEVF